MKRHILQCICLGILLSTALTSRIDETFLKMSRGYIYNADGQTQELLNMPNSSSVNCSLCHFSLNLIQNFVTDNLIDFIFDVVCNIFAFETPRVCNGLGSLYKEMLGTVVRRVVFDPYQWCPFLVPGCGNFINPLQSWTVPLTSVPKPPLIPASPPLEGSPQSRVLHVSDVHMDLNYTEGSNADCGEPLCCRPTSGSPAGPSAAAGKWGDFRQCDVPLRLFENMLQHINATDKFDYVIWTGDIPPHNIWDNSRSEVIYLLYEGCRLMHMYLGQVPIYPALGNHESFPANSFPIPEINGNDSIDWLYSEVAKAWSDWIPDDSGTIKKGGYYAVLVHPGLKLISLNTNYCYYMNAWIFLNTTDPTDQLAWLVDQLQMAEDNGEKVHIIGHVPPGNACFFVWSENYYNIISRYESTVVAQFFGHTHVDEFEVFYDKSGPTPRPFNIAYIGPSVTSHDGTNPAYRSYTVDGNYSQSSRMVLDHETYIVNLTEANLSDEPKWMLEYKARETYDMASLLPEDWGDLVDRMERNDTLFQAFYRYYKQMSDYAVEPCVGACKDKLLCQLRRGRSDDPISCEKYYII